MQNARPNVIDFAPSFELKVSPDSPGLANLRINCIVSIPTGIRILALIDAEESKADALEGESLDAGEKAARSRKRRNGATLEE